MTPDEMTFKVGDDGCSRFNKMEGRQAGVYTILICIIPPTVDRFKATTHSPSLHQVTAL